MTIKPDIYTPPKNIPGIKSEFGTPPKKPKLEFGATPPKKPKSFGGMGRGMGGTPPKKIKTEFGGKIFNLINYLCGQCCP